ncbi:MAG: phosphoribosylanthranilate isomerase [Aquaticitalea sp.]
MKYKDNIAEVATLHPDYLGFIFYEKSSRFFDGVIPDLPKSIKKVGVFVDSSIEEILEKVSLHNLDHIQLHGEESAEFCFRLKRHYEENNDEEISSSINRLPRYARNNGRIKIIKVFSIKDDFDFSELQPYESVCDYYLFDTKGKFPGGNGYTFNWEVLKNYPSTKPYFLSGGIGLDEVADLKGFLQTPESQYCHFIDVNSKFEIEAGLKDMERIKRFEKELNKIDTNLKS